MTILSHLGRSPCPIEPARQRGAIRPLALAIALLACGPASAEVFDWSDYFEDEESAPPGSVFSVAGVDLTLNWWSVNEDGSPFKAHGLDPENFVTFESSFIGGELDTVVISITGRPQFGEAPPVQNEDRVIMELLLDRPLNNVSFSITDIDQRDRPGSGWDDAVEVYYDSDLEGEYSNAAHQADYWSLEGASTSRDDEPFMDGWEGIADPPLDSKDANLNLHFGHPESGGTRIQRLRIEYFDAEDAVNVSSHFVSLTNVAFEVPPFEVRKSRTDGTGPVSDPGHVIDYEIAVQHTGMMSYSGIEVSDSLVNGAGEIVPLDAALSGGDSNDNALLDTGETWIYTASYTVSEADLASGGRISNTASVTANETPEPERTGTVVVDTTRVTIAKTLTSESGDQAGVAEAGETLTYRIALDNSGSAAAQDYSLEDVLQVADAGAIASIEASDGGSVSGTAVSWSGLTVPAGGELTLSVIAVLADPLPAGLETIANLARAAGEPDPICPSAQCVELPVEYPEPPPPPPPPPPPAPDPAPVPAMPLPLLLLLGAVIAGLAGRRLGPESAS